MDRHCVQTTGQCFGERAMLHDETRASTVLAEGQVEVACLSSDSFAKMLGGLKEALQQNLLEHVLHTVPVLSGLTQEERQEVASQMSKRTFAEGELICTQVRPSIRDIRCMGFKVIMGSWLLSAQDALNLGVLL